MKKAAIAWAGGIAAGLLALLGIAISNLYWPLAALPEALQFGIGWIPVALGLAAFILIQEVSRD